MKVYVLLQSLQYEGSDLEGVFSTMELAQAAAERIEKPTSAWRVSPDGVTSYADIQCGLWALVESEVES